MSANVFLDTNIIIYGYSQDEPEKRQRARECAQAHESWNRQYPHSHQSIERPVRDGLLIWP
jgi:predicted nucleic acid-binding protein